MQRNNSNHGATHDAVLLRIAMKPDCTASDLSDDLLLSRPTVWSIIGELRRAGVIRVRKIGRSHHYSANLDAPFRHPAVADVRSVGRWRD